MDATVSARLKWLAAFAVGAGLLWVGWMLPALLTALHVLLAIVLIFIVLMQSASAADLAGAFGGAGSQTAFGPRSAATFMTKATVWCAAMFMLTSLSLALRQSRTYAGSSVLNRKPVAPISQPAPPVHLPAAPSSAPVKH